MGGNAVGIEVRRGSDKEDTLLLNSRKDVFGHEHFANDICLRFDYIRSERLGAEDFRNEAKSF